MTLATVLATIPMVFKFFFLTVRAGTVLQPTDAEMCKSFNLKKTLHDSFVSDIAVFVLKRDVKLQLTHSHDSSTVAQIAERFEPNTVL